jgi:hypothetical protein
MRRNQTAPHPDAPLTARALERAIRAALPPGAPGIGPKTILREMRAGRLAARRVGKWWRTTVGKWWRTTWRAYLEWLEAQRVDPESPTPRSDAEAWAAGKVAEESRGA